MTAPWVALQIVFVVALVLIVVFLSGMAKRVLTVLDEVEKRLGNPLSGALGGLSVGERLPEFEAELGDGTRLTRQSLLTLQRPLLFLSPGCRPCEQLAKELLRAPAEIQSAVIVILPDGDSLSLPDRTLVLYELDRSLSNVFRNVATPRIYVLDDDGTVVEQFIPQLVEDLVHAIGHAREGGGEAGPSDALLHEVRTGTV